MFFLDSLGLISSIQTSERNFHGANPETRHEPMKMPTVLLYSECMMDFVCVGPEYAQSALKPNNYESSQDFTHLVAYPLSLVGKEVNLWSLWHLLDKRLGLLILLNFFIRFVLTIFLVSSILSILGDLVLRV